MAVDRIASRRRPAHLALFDATTLTARAVKEQLLERSFPIASIRLFGSSSDAEANLSEFGGEAMLVSVPDIDALGKLDIGFLCGTREDGARYLDWAARRKFVAIDLTSGTRTEVWEVRSPDGNNRIINQDKMTLDLDNNRALVTDRALDAIMAVDLDTGARTVLSDGSTPDGTNAFALPIYIAMDSTNNRALVLDVVLDAILAVDLSSGARTVVSNSTTPDSVNPLNNAQVLAVDSSNNRALVVDNSRSFLLAVDLTSGARTVISDDTTPDANNLLVTAQGIVVDSANNRALIGIGGGNVAVIAVDWNDAVG